MSKASRARIVAGLLLILIGGWFLAARFVPGLEEWTHIDFTWPLIVVGVGVALLIMGLAIGEPGMAVPACVVGGIGGLLYYQNLSGDWGSWAYAWALIPGFVGVGSILSGILGEQPRQSISGGLWLLFISAILFSFFSAMLGGPKVFGQYWPVLLILLGVWLLVRALTRRS